MTRLNIGDLEFNSEDVARKVENDIAFLADRMELLEKQTKPNAVILQTYKDMLESRQAVLGWLRQSNKHLATELPTEQIAAKH
ncbi:MAG: hypothetical protein EOO68_27545 [Moraxellaceae bacterium]|nr:MAG: hypothetical protein EOO68_27545 [Moraxellaceae bacterium]